MNLERVAGVFEALIGKPAWQVKKGHGSFLTLEFGDPSIVIREPKAPSPSRSDKVNEHFSQRLVTIRGQWHLWIYCCDWEIEKAGHVLAHNESTDKEIEKAAHELDGQCLESVTIKPDASSVFRFDLGGILRTSPYNEKKKYEQWMLYEPTGTVLEIRSDGTYSHSPGNTQEDSIQRFDLSD